MCRKPRLPGSHDLVGAAAAHLTLSDHDQPVAPNLLARRFEAADANRRWVGDTTELIVGSSSKLYRRPSSTPSRASRTCGPGEPSTLTTGDVARLAGRAPRPLIDVARDYMA
jgi:hypothetical protein